MKSVPIQAVARPGEAPKAPPNAPTDAPIPRAPIGGPLWALGFRPFYLLAALFATLTVPLWALQFSGWIGPIGLRGALWHAHEMVFGYTLAVVIGFLYTAGQNWSGQPTPRGAALMALAALWLLARVLVLSPYVVASAVVNVAVPWLAAWGLWRALRAGNNRRNYFFVGLLVLMGVATAAVHVHALVTLPLPVDLGLPLALDVVLFMIAVMAGRIVPMFSNNGVPGMQARRHERLETLALGSILLLAALDVTQGLAPWMRPLTAVACMAAALIHLARWWLWQPWKTLGNALVWVLHAAYLWVPIYLLLRACSLWGFVAPGVATHALTVGAIGLITLGMITRTALGHTGRALRAGPMEQAAYLLVLAAAVLRVGLPLIHPPALLWGVGLSAAAWTLAFALYLLRYIPFLTQPRADGRPG